MKKNFLTKLERYVNENPNEIVVRSSNRSKGITYEDMWDHSGRIYSYLSKRG